MKASSVSFKSATVLAIAGIAAGIGMAGSGNHAIMPAHAHLNLLGWVSLFLFGVYYRLHPALEESRLALAQIGIWTAGTVVLSVAVAFIHLGYEAADPVAAASSLVVLAGMALFAFLVFRPAPRTEPLMRAMTPAE